MWATVLFALLAIAVGGWLFTAFRQAHKVRALERSKEEIQVEETLVFDFLHGLGEAFRETIRPHDVHRLIVDGATRILDAHGGALYLADRTGNKLLPAFLSKGCPPLLSVPAHILRQAATAPLALDGFLRTQSIPRGEGLLGTVWATAQPVCLADIRDAPDLASLRQTALGTASVMATPLLYGKQNMGVLALGNGPTGTPFSQSDFVVFKSIAEQSAFALYNAIIYSEANEKKRLDHDLEIARAGHDAPLLYRHAKGCIETIKPPGMVLGIDAGSVFDRITNDFAVALERDDCLLLYTDGVTEALDAKGDEFGVERLSQSIRESAANGASGIVRRLIDDLRNFVGAQPQNDDITVIAIRKT